MSGIDHTQRIGLGIGADGLRAVGVGRGRILWALEVPLRQDEPLDAAIADILARAPLAKGPLRAWRRPALVAAVGPRFAQAKRLSGLPPAGDARVLDQIVKENAGRFFLKNGIPLVTTGVGMEAEDAPWAAAIEMPVVESVRRASHAVGLRLEGVVPTIKVVQASLMGDRITWNDGPQRFVIELAGGRLARVSRMTPADPSGRPPVQAGVPAGSPLAALDPDAARFADAFGAALLPKSERLAFRPDAAVADGARIPRWRVVLAATGLSVAAASAAFAPGLTATRVEREAGARLAALGDARSLAVATAVDLERVTNALAEVSAFEAGRRSPTLLLASLARALPEGSALIALRTDSVGGTITVLAPRAVSVLAALERLPDVVGPEILGLVTREVVDGHGVERVTVRFRFPAARTASTHEDR